MGFSLRKESFYPCPRSTLPPSWKCSAACCCGVFMRPSRSHPATPRKRTLPGGGSFRAPRPTPQFRASPPSITPAPALRIRWPCGIASGRGAPCRGVACCTRGRARGDVSRRGPGNGGCQRIAGRRPIDNVHSSRQFAGSPHFLCQHPQPTSISQAAFALFPR